MPLIKLYDLDAAYCNWAEGMGVEIGYTHQYEKAFFDFVGIDGDIMADTEQMPIQLNVTNKTAQYVRSLTSPHWRTLLRAHLIKQNSK